MPVINERYADCARHYGFQNFTVRHSKPNEKRVVERTIEYLRSSYLNGLEMEGLTLSALNHGVRQWMDNAANVRIHGTTRKTPVEMFALERSRCRRCRSSHTIAASCMPHEQTASIGWSSSPTSIPFHLNSQEGVSTSTSIRIGYPYTTRVR